MDNRNEGTHTNDNVYSVTYQQITPKNPDVQDEINLWYTDLDPEADAELFIHESDAIIKKDQLEDFFPTACFQLFAFYYTYDENSKLRTDHLCQILPKGSSQAGDNDKAGFRAVTRRHLKDLYNRIDFIRITRPKNTIKWYEVSRRELKNYIQVVKQFYGLTNFPDKEGDYYFAKKIGKWLPTNKLKNYESTHSEFELIDLNDWEENPGTVTNWPIFNGIKAFLKGLGVKLGSIFGNLFDVNSWNGTIDDIFENLDFSQFLNLNINDLLDGSFFADKTFRNLFQDGNNISSRFAEKINQVEELNTKLNTLQTNMRNIITNRSSWTTRPKDLWNTIKNLINTIFNWDLPGDDSPDN